MTKRISITVFFLLFVANPALSQAPKEKSAASLEEVYVTARRRVESVQETPLAVSVFSGDALEEAGLNQAEDLSAIVPSLHIQKGASNQIYIRGIGERTGYARVDPTVGIYLDSLYLPRSDGQLLGLIDIQSVQVLRGPQGTLFGKNTTGGALVLGLRKPGESRETVVSGGIGAHNKRHLRIAADVPLSDSVGSRWVVSTVKDDGFVKDVGTGERLNSLDQKAFIGQIRADLTDDLSLDALLYAGRVREQLSGNNCVINNDNALFVNGLGLMWPGDTDATNPHAYRDNCESNSKAQLGDLKVNMGAQPFYDKDLDTRLLGITGTWAISEDTQLKAIFGLRDETKGPALKSDNDGGPANWSEAIQIGDSDGGSASFEVQLSLNFLENRLNISTGLFYMEETNSETSLLTANLVGIDAAALAQLGTGSPPDRPTANGQPFVGQLLGSPIVISEFDLKNTTKAAYLQAVYEPTEQLQLTMGMRYTEEGRYSELGIRTSDADAIAQRLITSGSFGPGSDGVHPYTGPLGWLGDPVAVAQALFADEDGDGIPDFPMAPGYLQEDEKNIIFREFTPMLSAAYKLPDNWLQSSPLNAAMAYLTWSNGFKSGFGEPLLTDGLQVVKPETVENIEFGMKLDAFDNALRVNFALYTMNFENMQLNTVGTDSQNNLAVTHQNAGKSVIEGGEIEITWLPLPALLITLNASINNYKFEEFSEPDLLTLALTGERIPVDRSDENFPLSPEKSAAFSVSYTFTRDFGSITPRLDYAFKDEIFHGLDRASWTEARDDKSRSFSPSYQLWNARVSWQNPSEDTSMSFFVKNIADERYFFGTSVADSLGTFNRLFGAPRSWGLELKRTWQ